MRLCDCIRLIAFTSAFGTVQVALCAPDLPPTLLRAAANQLLLVGACELHSAPTALRVARLLSAAMALARARLAKRTNGTRCIVVGQRCSGKPCSQRK